MNRYQQDKSDHASVASIRIRFGQEDDVICACHRGSEIIVCEMIACSDPRKMHADL